MFRVTRPIKIHQLLSRKRRDKRDIDEDLFSIISVRTPVYLEHTKQLQRN